MYPCKMIIFVSQDMVTNSHVTGKGVSQDHGKKTSRPSSVFMN